jgi:hypothetical protein
VTATSSGSNGAIAGAASAINAIIKRVIRLIVAPLFRESCLKVLAHLLPLGAIIKASVLTSFALVEVSTIFFLLVKGAYKFEGD